MIEKIKYLFIKKVYADHNNAPAVKKTINELLARLSSDSIGLNIGSGQTKIDHRIKNLEIEPGEGIDYVGSVERIPCQDNYFDLVITQEVLEHVQCPVSAIKEIHRVLKMGGYAYIQIPFVIGYHPCPEDYWRFTHIGVHELVQSASFKIIKTDFSVGPAVGFYRILVEFLAILSSVFYWRIYKVAKLIFSIICYPIKWLDPILIKNKEAKRIAGGYFIVCQKI